MRCVSPQGKVSSGLPGHVMMTTMLMPEGTHCKSSLSL